MEPAAVRPRDLSEPDVVRAIKANWIEFYAHLGRAPGAELSAGPHLSWMLTGIPDAFLNVVFRTDLPPGRPGDVIDEAFSHFRERGIASLSWWDPGPEVGRHLVSRGLAFDEGPIGMAADLAMIQDDRSAPAGVTIDAVQDPSSLRSWTRIMGIGFGTPEAADPALFELFAGAGLESPTRLYLALLDGGPVATAQLFLGAGVAGIYSVTCLPEARGRGIGSAVTLAPLLEARRRGYGMAILQASDLGASVYRRLGFGDYGRLNEYRYRSVAEGPPGRG